MSNLLLNKSLLSHDNSASDYSSSDSDNSSSYSTSSSSSNNTLSDKSTSNSSSDSSDDSSSDSSTDSTTDTEDESRITIPQNEIKDELINIISKYDNNIDNAIIQLQNEIINIMTELININNIYNVLKKNQKCYIKVDFSFIIDHVIKHKTLLKTNLRRNSIVLNSLKKN